MKCWGISMQRKSLWSHALGDFLIKESLGLVCECFTLSNFIFSCLFVCVSPRKGGGSKVLLCYRNRIGC